MTGEESRRLHFCFLDSTGRNCNRNTPAPVKGNGVDALLTTWMILMQARWLKLRSSMMMRRLGHWSGSFIRSCRNWCARIARAERLKRTFPK